MRDLAWAWSVSEGQTWRVGGTSAGLLLQGQDDPRSPGVVVEDLEAGARGPAAVADHRADLGPSGLVEGLVRDVGRGEVDGPALPGLEGERLARQQRRPRVLPYPKDHLGTCLWAEVHRAQPDRPTVREPDRRA